MHASLQTFPLYTPLHAHGSRAQLCIRVFAHPECAMILCLKTACPKAHASTCGTASRLARTTGNDSRRALFLLEKARPFLVYIASMHDCTN